MLKSKWLQIVVVAFWMQAVPVYGGIDLILDIKPGALLLADRADQFEASRTHSGSYFSWTEIEQSENGACWMPTITAGIGIDFPVAPIVDISAGGGYLWNDAFYARMFLADLALRFKIGPITLGPHVSIIDFDPYWKSDASVTLISSDPGVLAGIGLTFGFHRISFTVNADYLNASFDASSSGNWQISDRSLDISGVSIRIGLLLRI